MKLKYCIPVLICLFLFTTPFSNTAFPDDQVIQKQVDLLDAGEALHKAAKYKRAMKKFQECVDLDPSTKKAAIAYHNIGNIYHAKMDDLGHAMQYYSKAVKTDPAVNDGFTQYCMAVIYEERGNYKQAVIEFTRAIRFKNNPRLIASRFNRAALYFNAGKFNQAIKDYDKIIELDPYYNSGIAFYYRGNCYFDLKQWANAIRDQTKALELNPESGKIYAQRGSAFHNAGEYGLATADYKKALSLTDDKQITQLVHTNLNKLSSRIENEQAQKKISGLMTEWGQNLDKASKAMSSGNFRISDRFISKCLDLTNQLRRAYMEIGVPQSQTRFIDALDMLSAVFVNMGEIVAITQNPTGKKNDLNDAAGLAVDAYALIERAIPLFEQAEMTDLANICLGIKNNLDTIVYELEKKLGCKIM